MKIQEITADDFDAKRDDNALEPGAYRITDTGPDWGFQDAHAFSPDGEGVYWYDSEAELVTEHGEGEEA